MAVRDFQLSWNGWKRIFLSTLFPPSCVACGQACAPSEGRSLEELEREGFCQHCRQGLFRIGTSICRVCGHPLEDRVGGKYAQRRALLCCRNCIQTPPRFRQARSVFAYTGPMQRALHRFKYDHIRSAGRILGELMGASLDRVDLPWEEYDGGIPVPLHPQRLRQRGFQQAWLLLGALPLPHRVENRSDILERWRMTPNQAGLGRLSRFDNMRDAIRVTQTGRQWVAKRRILLIDDVLTTGATANACAHALCDAGAECVDVLTLCRAIG